MTLVVAIIHRYAAPLKPENIGIAGTFCLMDRPLYPISSELKRASGDAPEGFFP